LIRPLIIQYIKSKKQGFQRWQEARNVWCGTNNNTATDTSTTSTSAGDISLPRTAVPIDVDEVIDVLFDPRWRGGTVVVAATSNRPTAAAAANVAVTPSSSGDGINTNTNPTSPSSVSTAQTSELLLLQTPNNVAPPLQTPRQQQQSSLPPRFPQNVPLPQMIDVLVDLWEAEGLDV
jgi:hypothetical protein